MKKVIAIDVDDVLAANAAGFVAYSNKRWGTNLTVDDYQEHWGEMWQIDHEESEQRALEFHQSSAIAEYDHDDTALPVLLELKRNYRLVVVTSRRKMVERPTLEWLNRHYEDVFDEIMFAGLFDAGNTEGAYKGTKLDTLKHIDAAYLIDDQTKHCFPAAEAGIRAILFGEYAWNREEALPDGVTRCRNWQAVGEFFRNESKL
jgi:uncharacterized HAD superfamily protein